MYLSQLEADLLLQMKKEFTTQDILVLGNHYIDITRTLKSIDKRDVFLLDIWRNGINLSKYKIQNRAKEVNVLVRVDVGGSPHQNPDGN